MERCPDDNEIAELLGGFADAGQRERFESHADSCESCRQLVAEAARAVASTGPARDDDASPRFRRRGETIDRYVVEELVGAGAMGVVYSAHDPELDRKVALKLLRSERHADSRARLLREAQAMARLSHPNVVSVFDAGTDADDVFLAMELVDGTTLAAWLAERQRSWREIVPVFVQAGMGLAAAHAAGIVHRDFKPANVLIRRDRRVQVSDFGLARSPREASPIPTEGEVVSTLTRTGALVGTPAYMAPEQLRGEPSDARTDLFAFCVALYEALFRARPFSGNSVAELKESVSSGRVVSSPSTGRVPRWLRRAVLRGLRPEPSMRYPDMAPLLRTLSRDPMRMRRVALFASVSLVALVAVAWAVFRSAPAPCEGAARKLAGVWDAERKAEIDARMRDAARVGEPERRALERTLDAYANAWSEAHTEACRATRVRGEQSEEILGLRIACLEQRRQSLAALSDALSRADSKAATSALSAAEDLPDLDVCAQAELLRQRRVPPKDSATARATAALEAELARAQVVFELGAPKDALAKGLAIVEKTRALGYEPLEARADALLAMASYELGDYAAAEKAFASAFAKAQSARDDELAAGTAARLCWVVGRRLARYGEGALWCQYADSAARRAGNPPKIVMRVALNRAALLRVQGRLEEAWIEAQRGLAIAVRSFDESTNQLAVALHNVAIVALDFGRYDEGAALLERAVAIRRKIFGAKNVEPARSLVNLGSALTAAGRPSAADAPLREALSIFRALLPARSPAIVRALTSVARNLLELGRAEQALPLIEEAERALAGAGKKGARLRGMALAVKATALVELGRYDDALDPAKVALELRSQLRGPDRAWSLEQLGEIALLRGRSIEAKLLLSQAAAALAKVYAKDHPLLSRNAMRRGEQFVAAREPRAALDPLNAARVALERDGAPKGADLPRTLTALARAHLALREPAAGIPISERSIEVASKRDIDPRVLARARFVLARSLMAVGRERERASRLSRDAVGAFATESPRDRAERAEITLWRKGQGFAP
jgi:tetratricopeptide (TPR) repeat protein/predicted Ser/Thr protein kinase